MKIQLGFSVVLACLSSVVTNVAASSDARDGKAVSVLAPAGEVEVLPAPNFSRPPILLDEEVFQGPSNQRIETAETVFMNPLPSYQSVIAAPVVAVPVVSQCCPKRPGKKCRCRKPAPVPMDFCLVTPCGCSHVACVNVPACCAGEQPTISWRQGAGGRQIAKLCWVCCDHEVKVVVNGRGKVRVRD